MDPLIDSAFDPYAFVRSAWLQRREYQIHNGKVPENNIMPESDSSPKPPEDGDPESLEEDSGPVGP